jgi:hypothetical protein
VVAPTRDSAGTDEAALPGRRRLGGGKAFLKPGSWLVGGGPDILAAPARSEPRKRATIVREESMLIDHDPTAASRRSRHV